MKTLLKFSVEEKDKLASSVLSDQVKALLTSLKADAGADNGTFKVICTTGSLDRHGETVNPDGWVMDNYLKNPIVLFAHNYSELPIGAVKSLTRDGNAWVAEGVFAAADASPMAGYCRKLYDAGILKTVSVGFIPLEMDAQYNSLKQELLEISFVPVPANPEAVAIAKEFGLDVLELKTKGWLTEPKTVDPEPPTPPADPPAPPAPEKTAADLEVQVKTLEAEVASLKAGRVLSEANRTLIRDCADSVRSSIRSMEKSVTALEDLLAQTEPSSGDPPPEKSAAPQEVNLVHLQRLIRIADKSLEDSLRVLARGVKK